MFCKGKLKLFSSTQGWGGFFFFFWLTKGCESVDYMTRRANSHFSCGSYNTRLLINISLMKHYFFRNIYGLKDFSHQAAILCDMRFLILKSWVTVLKLLMEWINIQGKHRYHVLCQIIKCSFQNSMKKLTLQMNR